MANKKTFKDASLKKGANSKFKKEFTKENTRGKGTPSFEPDKNKDFKSGNDWQWYFQNSQVARDAANFNYTNLAGLPIELETYSNGIYNKSNYQVPGIMAIDYHPTVGLSTNKNSAVNIAARQLYSYVRHANSGSRNYEAPDMMMYMLAVSSMHAYYCSLVRVYGLMNTYSPMNRYVPKAIVQALGFDFDDLSKNLATFRYLINQLAVKVNTFAVPKDLYIFDRQAYLNLHVFRDAEDFKSGFYVFRPTYWVWDGKTMDTGTALKPIYFPAPGNNGWTVDDIFGQISTLINGVLGNEDLGIISGDILKAFGDNGIKQLPGIDEKYVTIPVKDDGALCQIHNATIVGQLTSLDDTNNWITQDENGVIKFNPTLTNLNHSALQNSILDSGMVSPTPEFTMEATRLKAYGEVDAEDNVRLTTCGTELVTSVYLYILGELGGIDIISAVNTPVITVSGTMPELATMAAFHCFDWSPIFYVDHEEVIGQVIPMGELFNYTTIDGKDLDKMHTVALQSLFSVYNIYSKSV